MNHFYQNYAQIATTPLRKGALDIIAAGISRVLPHALIEEAVRYDPQFNSLIVQHRSHDMLRGRIFVIGGGKAAGYMAEAIEEMIGPERITAGIVTAVGKGYRTKRIAVVTAGHPFPDRAGEKAVHKILALKEKYDIGAKDLVVCLLSGGASALLPSPAEGVTLKDKIVASRTLIESGADIQAINAVRKHLSRVKGGRLAAWFEPATTVTLIISDVGNDDPSVIGSGPTAPDPTTYADALIAVASRDLRTVMPKSVIDHLEDGAAGRCEETPKRLAHAHSYVIGDTATALEAMAHRARERGYRPLIPAADLRGEVERLAKTVAERITALDPGYDVLLWGGEPTVRLPARHGQGGRNLHLAALLAAELRGLKGEWALITIGSDGREYLSDAAGALIDGNDRDSAALRQAIDRFDTYHYFKKTDSLLITGDTGTNIGDLGLFVRRAS